MGPSLGFFLGIFQIVIQAIAVYYSYKIFSFNRLNKGWLALAFALILMTFRRITALFIEINVLPNYSGWISYTDRIVLPTVISVFLLVGLFFMYKNFEDFDVVERKVGKIIGRKRK